MDDIDPQVAHDIAAHVLAAQLAATPNAHAIEEGHLRRLADLAVRAAISLIEAVPRVLGQRKDDAEAAEARDAHLAEAEAAAEAERKHKAHEAALVQIEATRKLAEQEQRAAEEAAREKALAESAELEAAARREAEGTTPEGVSVIGDQPTTADGVGPDGHAQHGDEHASLETRRPGVSVEGTDQPATMREGVVSEGDPHDHVHPAGEGTNAGGGELTGHAAP